MRRATRTIAILLTAAVPLLATCKDEPPEDDGPTIIPIDAAPNPFFFDAGDGGVAKRSANSNGKLLIDPGAEEPTLVTQAIATMTSTGRITGSVRFGSTSEGVRVSLDLEGLTGLAGYILTIHMLGDCSAPDGSRAGPGFMFDNGNTSGVLGEIKTDVSGNAQGDAKIPGPEIQGPFSIIGRALVITAAKPGANGKPTGQPTGKGLACGVIGVYGNIPSPEPVE
ncbi:MAG TPA: superoxide dismutase family protein [Labilithrix sp.]|jgi:Cu/Zn superoxide dismutase|nr:superoxide dismutase family protein [Labilithrix sp.]